MMLFAIPFFTTRFQYRDFMFSHFLFIDFDVNSQFHCSSLSRERLPFFSEENPFL